VKNYPDRSLLNQSVILGCFSPQDDATVKCWGSNGAGQLGLGDTFNRGDDANGSCPPSFVTASRVPAPRVLTLAPANAFSAVLSMEGRVVGLSWEKLKPQDPECSCRDGDEPAFSRPWGWEDGRSRQRWMETYVRSAGKPLYVHPETSKNAW
jgi:hypothetical protein